MSAMVRTGFLVILLMGACLTGCNSTPQNVKQAEALYYGGNYAAAAAALQHDTTKKDENFVLNNCRYGSCALAAGELPAADNAFMSAYEVINSVDTNSGGRTLGATLVFEGIKVWKGEPFERAMAHYYLGLTKMVEGDYDNARAGFRNSLFKLRDYAKDKKGAPESDQYQQLESSFALGYFGLGVCYMQTHQADLARANFDEAVKRAPYLKDVAAQAEQPGTNVLIFVDAGRGPRRAAKGWYNEESAFGPTPREAGPIPELYGSIDGQALNSNIRYDMVDTLAMAQEQKWQDIDTIRKVKAAVGTGAMAAGAGLAGDGAYRGDTGMALAGLGVAALGAALAASSQADLRYWEMLPRTVYVVPAQVTPGTHTFQVSRGQVGQPGVPGAGEGGWCDGAVRAVAIKQVLRPKKLRQRKWAGILGRQEVAKFAILAATGGDKFARKKRIRDAKARYLPSLA